MTEAQSRATGAKNCLGGAWGCKQGWCVLVHDDLLLTAQHRQPDGKAAVLYRVSCLGVGGRELLGQPLADPFLELEVLERVVVQQPQERRRRAHLDKHHGTHTRRLQNTPHASA
jgi:hypothetical protein